jgi:hypothetical protein
MPKRKVKSRRDRGSRDKKGTRNYDYRDQEFSNITFTKATRKRDRKIRKEIGDETKKVERKDNRRKRNDLVILNKNIQDSFLPRCPIERERRRRAYFSFRKARPHAKLKNIGADRFTMRRCRK